ncbi:unnamed protein product [Closterium sp. NIES-65]|nr:unnamed protein product [Closterium sp. NIES-65]
MYITPCYLVTRLPDSLPSVKDHFPILCSTTLTVDPLEERLLAAKKNIVAVGASRGDLRAPFFEGCSRVPLLPSVASAVAVNLVGTESVGAASAPSRRRHSGRSKGGKGARGDGGGGGGGSGGGGGGGGGGEGGGGSGSFGGGGGGGGGGGSCSGGGGGGSGGGAARGGAVQRGGLGGGQRQQQQRSRETLSPQQLCEWYAGRGRSGGAGPCAYVLRTGERTGETCKGPHATQRWFGRLTDAWRAQFPDATELLCWGDLLSRLVAVSLADPSRGLVLAHSSTVLPCPADPSGSLSGLHLPSFSTNLVSGADLQDAWVDQFTPGSQRVTHCSCTRTGRHLATFTRQLGSSLYTLSTVSPPVAESGQVAALGQGRQRPAPHSSEFPPTEAPLQNLHMDVWGPARVSGQGHERYFLLVVDNYLRYTTVFPLRRKGEVPEVLIDWIRAARR